MAHAAKSTQLFQKSFLYLNYTQVFPKKSLLSHFCPAKAPHQKIPVSKGSLHIMCERNVLEVLLQRRWRKNCAESANSVVLKIVFTIFSTHRSTALAKKSARCFWITNNVAGTFRHAESHFRRAGGIQGTFTIPHIHKQAVLHNPHLRKCVFGQLFHPFIIMIIWQNLKPHWPQTRMISLRLCPGVKLPWKVGQSNAMHCWTRVNHVVWKNRDVVSPKMFNKNVLQFTRKYIHTFIPSFIPSFTHSFIHACIHTIYALIDTLIHIMHAFKMCTTHVQCLSHSHD